MQGKRKEAGRGKKGGESGGEKRGRFGPTQLLCVAGVHTPPPPNSVEIGPFPWIPQTTDNSPSTVLSACVHAQSNKQLLYHYLEVPPDLEGG